MDESEKTARDVALDSAGSALASVTAAAAAALGFGPGVATGLAVLGGTIPGMIRTGFQRRAERRCALAQEAIARVAVEYDVDLSELNETPEATECFLTMFYDLMDSIDDAAALPLGHIAMSYVQEHKPPDAFFRAFGRTVRELESGQLRALEMLFRTCVTRIHSGIAETPRSEVIRTGFQDPTGRVLKARGKDADHWTTVMELDNGFQLLFLLRQHGLAVEPTDLPGVFDGSPFSVRIELAIAERCLRHLASTNAG